MNYVYSLFAFGLGLVLYRATRALYYNWKHTRHVKQIREELFRQWLLENKSRHIKPWTIQQAFRLKNRQLITAYKNEFWHEFCVEQRINEEKEKRAQWAEKAMLEYVDDIRFEEN